MLRLYWPKERAKWDDICSSISNLSRNAASSEKSNEIAVGPDALTTKIQKLSTLFCREVEQPKLIQCTVPALEPRTKSNLLRWHPVGTIYET